MKTGVYSKITEVTQVDKQILEKHGMATTVRRELGADIDAACGQLRRRAMGSGKRPVTYD